MKRSSNKAPGTVNIATLKAQLAKYLRLVKSGEEVVVLDHKMPVARIIPFEAATAPLESITPSSPFSEFAKLKIPARREIRVDSLSLLLEERGSR